MDTLLSKDPLDVNDPGYQEPVPKDEPFATSAKGGSGAASGGAQTRQNEKKERGEKTGGTVPYGWDADADGRLTPNESEQAVLEAIENLRDRGWSLRAICAEMEARGVKTKTGKTTWQPKVISRLLKDAA